MNHFIKDEDDSFKRFHRTLIRHPLLDKTIDEIFPFLSNPVGDELILLVGPTGAGKSTLIEFINQKINEKHRNEMKLNPSLMPAILVKADSYGESRFSWRGIFNEILIAGKEPLLNKKVSNSMREDGRMESFHSNGKVTLQALGKNVENLFKYRDVKVLIIDEAAYILNCSPERQLDQTKALRSLADKLVGGIVVLVGSFDIMNVVRLEAQLARRIRIVHFRRYKLGNGKQERMFSNATKSLWDSIEIDKFDLDEEVIHLLMERSGGCIGTLKTFMLNAYRIALYAKKNKILKNHLEKSIHSKGKANWIIKASVMGEREIDEELIYQ